MINGIVFNYVKIYTNLISHKGDIRTSCFARLAALHAVTNSIEG